MPEGQCTQTHFLVPAPPSELVLFFPLVTLQSTEGLLIEGTTAPVSSPPPLVLLRIYLPLSLPPQVKCPQCGGFFPWRSWGEFLNANTRPGNGGVLRFPKGQVTGTPSAAFIQSTRRGCAGSLTVPLPCSRSRGPDPSRPRCSTVSRTALAPKMRKRTRRPRKAAAKKHQLRSLLPRRSSSRSRELSSTEQGGGMPGCPGS